MTILSISGAPGSGKTTLMKHLLDAERDIKPLLSITTRAKKISDPDTGEYYWASQPEFERMAKNSDFLWQVEVHGNRYGTRKMDIIDALNLKSLRIAILALEAVKILREFAADQRRSAAVQSIFITHKDENELYRRLLERGDSPEEAAIRVRDGRTWESDARKSELWFKYLKGEKPIEKVFDETVAFLEQKNWAI